MLWEAHGPWSPSTKEMRPHVMEHVEPVEAYTLWRDGPDHRMLVNLALPLANMDCSQAAQQLAA